MDLSPPEALVRMVPADATHHLGLGGHAGPTSCIHGYKNFQVTLRAQHPAQTALPHIHLPINIKFMSTLERKIGDSIVSPIGYGAMGIAGVYTSKLPDDQRLKVG